MISKEYRLINEFLIFCEPSKTKICDNKSSNGPVIAGLILGMGNAHKENFAKIVITVK